MKTLLKRSQWLAAAVVSAATFAALPMTAEAKEPTLDSLLDQIGVPDGTPESGAELFNAATGKDGLSSGLLFEFSGYKKFNSFGMYNANDITDTFELISGKVKAPDERPLTEKWFGVNEIFKTFEDTFEGVFGFYLTNKIGDTFYSEVGKNSDGADHFVAYQGDGSTRLNDPFPFPAKTFGLTDWVMAFEDLPADAERGDGVYNFNYDDDKNDMVVFVRQVEAVPEPATLLGLAAVVGGALSLRRRQVA